MLTCIPDAHYLALTCIVLPTRISGILAREILSLFALVSQGARVRGWVVHRPGIQRNGRRWDEKRSAPSLACCTDSKVPRLGVVPSSCAMISVGASELGYWQIFTLTYPKEKPVVEILQVFSEF